ncbi:MAG: glutaredoxin domain-containing protein [Polyangiaceae bacterium]
MLAGSPSAVRIFTTSRCGYCVVAKRLLGARGIPYEEVDVTGNAGARAWLLEATRRRTIPQIFVGKRSIGGYAELAALDRSGELRKLLEPSIPWLDSP